MEQKGSHPQGQICYQNNYILDFSPDPQMPKATHTHNAVSQQQPKSISRNSKSKYKPHSKSLKTKRKSLKDNNSDEHDIYQNIQQQKQHKNSGQKKSHENGSIKAQEKQRCKHNVGLKQRKKSSVTNVAQFEQKMSKYLQTKELFPRRDSKASKTKQFQKVQIEQCHQKPASKRSSKCGQEHKICRSSSALGKLKDNGELLSIFNFYQKTFDLNMDTCLKLATSNKNYNSTSAAVSRQNQKPSQEKINIQNCLERPASVCLQSKPSENKQKASKKKVSSKKVSLGKENNPKHIVNGRLTPVSRKSFSNKNLPKRKSHCEIDKVSQQPKGSKSIMSKKQSTNNIEMDMKRARHSYCVELQNRSKKIAMQSEEQTERLQSSRVQQSSCLGEQRESQVSQSFNTKCRVSKVQEESSTHEELKSSAINERAVENSNQGEKNQDVLVSKHNSQEKNSDQMMAEGEAIHRKQSDLQSKSRQCDSQSLGDLNSLTKPQEENSLFDCEEISILYDEGQETYLQMQAKLNEISIDL